MSVSSAFDELESRSAVFESDWLASTPFFFNLRSGAASTNIHEVIPGSAEARFHPEGLYNFLDYGYSVFGQTPVEDVQFLLPGSRLHRCIDGRLVVAVLNDPLQMWWDYHLSEEDVIELIRERVQNWEANLPSDQEIVLPLSGGFDSRLLLWCLRDKSRVRAYTYGISEDQGQSTEVVHARALAEQLGVRWEQIRLGKFHRHFLEWDAEFGASTHAHGMYHFEFYSEILTRLPGTHAFLSGIVGDAWAGSIPFQQLNGAEDLVSLGYSHGLRADPDKLRLPAMPALRNQFWDSHRKELTDHRYQIVSTIRFKIMLLSYLMRVPRLFGFQPWTPYLDIDIAMAMLNLPPDRRANRQWQREFFERVGLDLENRRLKGSRRNSLNHQAMKLQPLCPLNVKLLDGVFDRDYLNWINRTAVLTSFSEARSRLLRIPKIGGVVRRMGVKDRSLEAYCGYLCLKPIENVLSR